MSPSLGTSKRGRCGSSVRGFDAGKVQRDTLHANGPLQRCPVKRTGENDISRRSLDRNVDGKTAFVHAKITAYDRGGAALACEIAADRHVPLQTKLRSTLRRAIGRGAGKTPSSGQVAYRP